MILKHNVKSFSDQKIDFEASDRYSELTSSYKKKAHGCLMIIAWIFFASTGIILSRYRDVHSIIQQIYRIIYLNNIYVTIKTIEDIIGTCTGTRNCVALTFGFCYTDQR